jgi:hypothetical protein
VATCLARPCSDIGRAEAVIDTAPRAASVSTRIDLPLLGSIDLGSQSLLVSTALIAFVDGFNACSL